jgi:hypothetical protein
MSLEWRNESVTLADDRLNESRVFRIVAKRPPDFADSGVDRRVVVDEHVRTPECRLNLGAIDECARLAHEEDEYLHRDLLELDALTPSPQRVCGDIELEVAKTEAA